jgi:hypothetical protein
MAVAPDGGTLVSNDGGKSRPDDPLEDELDESLDPTLHDAIAERYLAQGIDLLSDSLPTRLDPKLAARLEGLIGDVSEVRVHTGKAATEAARGMDARAFAVGDRDIFVDEAEHNPGTLQGQALLAHEAAHTQDASTGFARSARTGPTGDRREAYAQEVERAFAQEDDPAPVAEPVVETDERNAPSANEIAEEPKVDKVALTQRIKEILEERERFSRERHGS